MVKALALSRNTSLKLASALALMTLASCLDHADIASTASAPSSSAPSAPASLAAPISLAAIGLRGAVDTRQAAAAKPFILADDLVPSWGPDDDVATASIAASLSRQGRIKVEVGFAPGDGQTALREALTEALAARAPAGARLDMEVLGNISISTLETHETEVTLEWRVTRPDGSLLGAVTQTGATSPDRIAAYWGDFAKEAAAPAADGILALLGA